MLALGYSKYVTQGGDWGFLITRVMGHMYPDHVMALHTNWPFPGFPSVISSPLLALTSLFKHALGSFFYTAAETESFARAKDYATGSGRGYMAMFSTKPQTMSYSLSDSPSGLLAFIYEKLHEWTDEYPWTDEEILTWISIYWFSEAGPGASGFIYYEFDKQKEWPLSRLQSWVDKPLGFTYFPMEIVNLPRAWLGSMGRVVLVSENEKGGHFAAWERPEIISGELIRMFGRGGGAFGVIEGKTGY